MKNVLVLSFIIAEMITFSAAATDRYVDNIDGTTGGNGLTWATAQRYLRPVLLASSSGDVVHIRKSANPYYVDQDNAHGDGGDDSDHSFTIPLGVFVVGGYIGGTGSDKDDIVTDLGGQTILSGAITSNAHASHVVYQPNHHSTLAVVLRNVTIQDGGDTGTQKGGGIYGALITLVNSKVINCKAKKGGAFYCLKDTGTPQQGAAGFHACYFAGNDGGIDGSTDSGAIDGDDSTNCFFFNCLFTDNTNNKSGGNGGAVHHTTTGGFWFLNCTFSKNAAGTAKDIYGTSGTEARNCVFYSNSSNLVDGDSDLKLRYCYYGASALSATFDTEANIVSSANPFIDFTNNDFHLNPGHPAIPSSPIDTGKEGGTVFGNTYPPDTWDLDRDSDTSEPLPGLDQADERVTHCNGGAAGDWPDMGCYEVQHACDADFDSDASVGSADSGILLGAWTGSGNSCIYGGANHCCCDLDSDGDIDAGDLSILLGAWGSCYASFAGGGDCMSPAELAEVLGFGSVDEFCEWLMGTMSPGEAQTYLDAYLAC